MIYLFRLLYIILTIAYIPAAVIDALSIIIEYMISGMTFVLIDKIKWARNNINLEMMNIELSKKDEY